MLNNQKNIALFYSDYDIPESFLPYLENNIFKLRVVNPVDELKNPFSYNIIYKDKYIKDVNYLVELLKEAAGEFNPMVEREIGRLLGYDKDDIEFYITNCYSNGLFI
ncbi:hypothetical protein BKL49_06835 [Rodentibacter myodis]|uniref:Hemocin immunity protein n=2 Tax=Rodentibacter myodis TaxID=1907939 RepID=A0A1V3JQ16_9PAST|nr:hypothetical protein BKL49_06835 [Rodentibacter myodis]